MDDVTIDLTADDNILGDARPTKSKKRKKSYIIPIVIIALIALLVVLIKFNVGGITKKYIAPKIEDIPIINKILPKSKKEEGIYDGRTKKQLIDIISSTETELEVSQLEMEEQLKRISDLEGKIEDLEVFEEEYAIFKEEKRVFDETVANMQKDEFARFYEQIHPETAQTVYSQIVQVQQMTKEQKKYSALISEMDEIRAAKVLENLSQTDMDIVLSIFSNMDTENASAILDEMESKIASTVVKQLSPE